MQIDISDLNDLPAACMKLLEFAGDIKIFAFNGEMGTGKTTLIKVLCKHLGSTDHFSSPTYSIVNEYQSKVGKLYHFDLYRLNSSEELFDIGFEEYLGSGNYCFIEWPQKSIPFFTKPYLSITINQNKNNRYISAQIKGH